MQIRPYRAKYLVQWNARQSQNNPVQLTDRVVEAVLHQQGIPFEHSNEYRSVYSYDKLLEQLMHYDQTYYLQSVNADLKFGLSVAFRMFSCPNPNLRLSPVSLMGATSDLLHDLAIKGDRSAGLTAYGLSKFEAFTVALDKSVDILQQDKVPAPCLAGVRTQRKGKTRLVWMYPEEMTIIEATVARSLINYFKGIQHPMSFGDFSHETGQRIRKSCSSNKFFYSIDYSQFDSTVPTLMIKYAFNAFRTWFNLEDKIYEDVTLRKVFDVIQGYFINTPIVMPSKGKYPNMFTGKRGGVPSGSYFTQLVDSFVNIALTFTLSSKFGLNLKEDHVYVLGDDSLFFTNDGRLAELVNEISEYVKTYGFKINLDKSECGTTTATVPYLGRKWRNGFPIRPMSDVIRGALYPENYRRYSVSLGQRQTQAFNVIGSYLLTSYIDDPKCDLNRLNHQYSMSPWMSSGFSAYLLQEGLVPGHVLKRALF